MQAQPSGALAAASRARLLMILGGLVTVLVAVVAYGTYGVVTRQPITRLPGMSVLARNVAPHFLFNIYGVVEPRGLAVSSDGRLIYVVQQGGDRSVNVFDRMGQPVTTLTAPNSTSTTRQPVYLAIAPDGRVFVTDIYRAELQVYDQDGQFMGVIQSPEKETRWAPVGVTIDQAGNLYVTDVATVPQRVVVFDVHYRKKAEYQRPVTIEGEQASLGAIALDQNGRLFVSDALMATVDVFGADGQLVPPQQAGAFKAGLHEGVWIDDQQRLYVVDTIASAIQVFDVKTSPAKLLFSFGQEGNNDGQFEYPTGVSGDSTGRVYVADRVNNRVQVWGY